MKLLCSYSLLFLLLFVGAACERHPASQTIPGYEEKKALQQKEAEEKPIAPSCCTSGAPEDQSTNKVAPEPTE
ncbi:MAG: hypothetical protein A3F67_08435 [Verrucomicrobia bacterium RIFCSPHIGHO2_12_FULL_41_10]|nr:MAG: hypothetical protein A3F67_08435 [Verrucomicrobia bacterium RIFCSPHIGHO2_12_FULL_41_10]HLB33151.1 hypothetical protein [Chthoniobacterales bacterium]